MSDTCPDCGLYIKAHPPSGECPERPLGRDISNEDLAECVRTVERLMGAKFAGDLYRQAYAETFGIPASEVTDDQRRQVKIAAFGSAFGSVSPRLRGRSNGPMLDDAAFVPELKASGTTLELLTADERRQIFKHNGDLVGSDTVLSWTVRFPGGRPFQVVVADQVGREEWERLGNTVLWRVEPPRMKTLRELHAEAQAERDRKQAERAADVVWLEEVLAKNIPMYQWPPTYVWSGATPEQYREHFRTQVRSAGRFYRLGVACDHCGTELINPEPGVVLASNPPQRKVACIGCGWSGSSSRV